MLVDFKQTESTFIAIGPGWCTFRFECEDVTDYFSLYVSIALYCVVVILVESMRRLHNNDFKRTESTLVIVHD